ncbi:3'-5' DNA helicase [Coemansia sp. RSA 1939]|nr:3'-5' DNA helicase [Coemansia sp. RSA 1939]
MITANTGNMDGFDDFNLDDISGELLDDLLKDDLEPDTGPVKPPISIPAQPKAASGAGLHQQQWLQQRAQPKSTPKHKPGQQTITSMFGTLAKPTLHSHVPQKRPAQSRTGIDGIPADSTSSARKEPKLDNSQIQDIVDLIDLDDDIDEFVSQNLPDLRPSHVRQAHQQTFQTKEIVIRNRGDNSLAESLHDMDRDAMRTYMYPLIDGQPARAYQQGAIHRCIFQNTLVALPTGMGKTLVAVVVMANFARWFPNSLSIFLAPTRPLVAQQMQAWNWIVEMNGSTQPKARETLWNEARFVFSTPQVLQNDLKAGTLSIDNAKRVSLLVIDEAHRATGKYAYGESINNLYMINHGHEAPTYNPLQPAPPDPFRVMALTATPGSNIGAVREIVQRLHIAHIFLRTEESMDVVPYIHGRQIEEISIDIPPWLAAARDCFATVIGRSVNILCNVCKAMSDPGDLKRISGFQVRINRDRFLAHHGGGGGGMDVARVSSEFTVLTSLSHIMQLLSEHGLRPAWRAIRSWEVEVMKASYEMATASRAKVQCCQSKEWVAMSQEFKLLIDLLDRKQQPTASTSVSLANVTPGSMSRSSESTSRIGAGSSGPTGTGALRRTDVVSNYFNVATNRNLPGNTVAQVAANHVSASMLAHPEFLGHPKLETLVRIVNTHFETSAGGSDGGSTKIIVFSQYRGSVSEIVDVLSKASPLIKCEQFIGQSSTGGGGASTSSTGNSDNSRGRGRGRGRGAWQRSSGGNNRGYFRGRGRGGSPYGGNNQRSAGGRGTSNSSGYNSSDNETDILAELEGELGEMRGQTQKEQLAVMTRFRDGQTNVIVATCVGEEGLDIGEVDLIINYDAPSSPIRMLQRIGRTGRARRGKVIVFLAKDTREENSYKKAQREYKSVQEKIASGRGLDLRADLSPPMIPPTLPQGLPARNEVLIYKHEIAQNNAADESAGTNGRSKVRGTRKKGMSTSGNTATMGIDPDEICEFRRLLEKYQCSSVQTDDTNQRLTAVTRLLNGGVAWQASESPHHLVSHSHRSTVYRHMMLGLENARFESMSTSRHKSFCGGASNQAPKMTIPTLASSMVDHNSVRMADLLGSHNSIHKGGRFPSINKRNGNSKSRLSGSAAIDTLHILAGNSDSDDDLADIELILSKGLPAANAPPRSEFASAASYRQYPFRKLSGRISGEPPVHGRVSPDRGELSKLVNGGNWSSSKTNTTGHQRCPSSQNSILDSIESLVKSGKAKRAFEWTLALDDELVRLAKSQGIELGLAEESQQGRTDVSDKRVSELSGSIFGDIGQPGSFDKLYDDDMLVSSTTSGKQASKATIIDGLDLTPKKTDANLQVLCPESDPEDDNNRDMAFDYLDAWAFSSLEDLQVSTPPTQPVPDAFQLIQHTTISDARIEERTNVPVSEGTQQSITELVVTEDSSDLDKQLEAFDIDDQDIMVLSDDDSSTEEPSLSNADNGRNAKQQQQCSSTDEPQTPVNCLDKLNRRTRMVLGSSPPSSSPMRMTRKRQLHPSSSSFEDAEPVFNEVFNDSATKNNSGDCDLSSSPIFRNAKRLVRGKPLDAGRSSTSTTKSREPKQVGGSVRIARSPVVVQKQKKLRKLRPPPKQMRNMFIDTEAGIGDSDDEHDTKTSAHVRNGMEISDDESDGEDLNQDLSSFIVDDDHVDFTSPDALDRSTNASNALANGDGETPRRNIGDVYRRSLNESPVTPISEIMRRLAEREKARKWVDDTPTKPRESAGRNVLDLHPNKSSSSDCDDDSACDDDGAEAELVGSSSDFDNVEDMFSQAG